MCVTEEASADAVQRFEAFEKKDWSTENIHDSVDPIIISLASDDEEEDLILDGTEV